MNEGKKKPGSGRLKKEYFDETVIELAQTSFLGNLRTERGFSIQKCYAKPQKPFAKNILILLINQHLFNLPDIASGFLENSDQVLEGREIFLSFIFWLSIDLEPTGKKFCKFVEI